MNYDDSDEEVRAYDLIVDNEGDYGIVIDKWEEVCLGIITTYEDEGETEIAALWFKTYADAISAFCKKTKTITKPDLISDFGFCRTNLNSVELVERLSITTWKELLGVDKKNY